MADPSAGGATSAAALPKPDPLWGDWDAPPRIPDIPELHLSGFDGPMDLLLDLAERQRIYLGGISVLQLAEQFVAAMTRLERHVTLERRADWMVMATRLLLLRSRLLFPASPAAEQAAAHEASRQARQLGDLLLPRAGADWLEQRSQLGRDLFTRPHLRAPRVVSYMALVAGQTGDYEIDFVCCLPAVRADDPHRALKARSAVASSLMAVLELTRGGEASADQAEPAAAILLRQPPSSATG